MVIFVRDFDFSHLLNSLFGIDVKLKMFKIFDLRALRPCGPINSSSSWGLARFAGLLQIDSQIHRIAFYIYRLEFQGFLNPKL